MKVDGDNRDSTSDEDEWGGILPVPNDHPGDAVHGLGTKPQKPPTGEELRVIKDATDLFRSSSFKLQARQVRSIDVLFLTLSLR
jgi:U3 small nucleolar RNA-associated protein 22